MQQAGATQPLTPVICSGFWCVVSSSASGLWCLRAIGHAAHTCMPLVTSQSAAGVQRLQGEKGADSSASTLSPASPALALSWALWPASALCTDDITRNVPTTCATSTSQDSPMQKRFRLERCHVLRTWGRRRSSCPPAPGPWSARCAPGLSAAGCDPASSAPRPPAESQSIDRRERQEESMGLMLTGFCASVAATFTF